MALELLRIDVGEELRARDAGVVDDDVDPPPGVERSSDHPLRSRRIGDVAGVGDHLGAERPQRRGRTFGRLLVTALLGESEGPAAEVVQHDADTALGQVTGVREAEALLVAPSGDDRDPTVEPAVVERLDVRDPIHRAGVSPRHRPWSRS